MTQNVVMQKEAMTADEPLTVVQLICDKDAFVAFSQLLQQGVAIKGPVSATVRAVLCGHMGVDPKYLEDRIRTIFLDGKPVDDIDSAVVRHGSVLALSGAMPGLVGAILRRGGPLAAMRREITHTEDAESAATGQGLFVLKLFNLLVKEMGPAVLDQGVLVSDADMSEFFRNRSGNFWSGCRRILVDGEAVDVSALQQRGWQSKGRLVALRCTLDAT